MRPPFPAFLLAGLVLLPENASAFNRTTTSQGTPIIWQAKDMPVPYYINDRGTPDVEDEEEFEAVLRGMERWTGRCDVCFWLDYKGLEDDGPVFDDGKNTIGWLERRWPYAQEAIAITTNLIEDNGDIYETDMELNGRDFTWAIISDQECDRHNGVVDVENIVTHEAGHFLGLGHTPIIEATMFAQAVDGDCTKRTLHQDDKDGLRDIYGCEDACGNDDDDDTSGSDDDDSPPPPKDPEGSDPGCSCVQVSNRPDSTLVLLALTLGWTFLWRRRPA